MYKEEGYLSIEASFLFPLITVLIWLLIIVGFFLYNTSYIRQSAYVAAIRGAAMKREGRDVIEKEIGIQVEKLLEDKLVMVNQWDYKIKVNTSQIIVTIEAEMIHPLFSFISEKQGIWNIEGTGSAVRYDPVEIIRNYRK